MIVVDKLEIVHIIYMSKVHVYELRHRVNWRSKIWLFETRSRLLSRHLALNSDDLIYNYNNVQGKSTWFFVAINSVLKSLPFQPGDGIVIYSWTYGAVRNTCESVAKKTGSTQFPQLFIACYCL